jgi:hypothetical protein
MWQKFVATAHVYVEVIRRRDDRMSVYERFVRFGLDCAITND